MHWNSSLSYYQTKQEHLDSLNIKLFSLNSGPSFTFKDLALKTDLTAGYTQIILDQHSYMKLYSLRAGAEHVLSENWKLNGALKAEYRDFINSPTVFTYKDRSGVAVEGEVGATYALTKKDFPEYDTECT